MEKDEPERCGIVYENGEVEEVQNVHDKPMDHFSIMESELLKPGVVASFHTHPRGDANLSIDDYFAFRAFSTFRHYIISPDEIWCFHTINGILCRYENTDLPRFPADLMPRKYQS